MYYIWLTLFNYQCDFSHYVLNILINVRSKAEGSIGGQKISYFNRRVYFDRVHDPWR